MKYSEIYTPDFLEMLAEKADKQVDEFIELIDSHSIDIENARVDIEFLAQNLQLEIEYQNMPNDSGDISGNIITIDDTESIERKRFTIGHEIGHFLLGDVEAARKDSNTGYSRKEMEHEKIANAVSAELLMPRKLVLNNVNVAIKQYGLDEDSLSDDQLSLLINIVSRVMQVSVQALTYRVKNLQLFTD